MNIDHHKWAIYLDGRLVRHVSDKLPLYMLQRMFDDWKLFVEYDDINRVMHMHRNY